ncbi:MAG TPA: DUF2336 domain-containing protein [Acetobacteraceae bacterium]|nr:DUF2336 domain-containing protein [Acetobacteraceae bacterium]
MMEGANRAVPADEAARVRLGSRAGTQADVLVGLADDPSVTVRAALALNSAAPARANQELAHDRDEPVRILLARKLAALAPGLSAVEQARLYQETWDTLTTLVADEAAHVRAVIAEAIKELPNAPRELILRLARDADTSVCEPVIQLSPLLTTEDLIALVAMAPSAGTVGAVARRADLEPAVSDAVAATADVAAIRALLANPTAQIREATLDALVARSVDHPDWHEPLVRRPSLPPHAARMLSEIVATHLLAELATRADLEPRLAEQLRRRVAVRLTPSAPEPVAPIDTSADEALAQAHAAAMRGELAEDSLLAVARRGDARYATALLAVASGMPVSVVDRASSLRSAKGLVSLVWKAGFTMRAAVALQTLLARLAPDAVLTAGPAGSFPLAVEEMRWQLDFLARMGA